MADWEINVPLDIPQENVLRSNESKVVIGSAGSGKTLLAVHKAKNIQASQKGTFYVIVLTRALRAFISSGVRKLEIPNTKVLYAWEWKERYNCPSADYIMIDEAQDFGEEDINRFKEKANKMVLFFGDTAQQVYESTTNGDLCVSMEEIKAITELAEIALSGNHRLYPSIAKVAQYLNHDEDIVSNCKKSGGNKPVVKQFGSQSEELDWIVEQIKNRQLKDVGILVKYG
jgi:superfamily I DNA/RNA helicase